MSQKAHHLTVSFTKMSGPLGGNCGHLPLQARKHLEPGTGSSFSRCLEAKERLQTKGQSIKIRSRQFYSPDNLLFKVLYTVWTYLTVFLSGPVSIESSSCPTLGPDSIMLLEKRDKKSSMAWGWGGGGGAGCWVEEGSPQSTPQETGLQGHHSHLIFSFFFLIAKDTTTVGTRIYLHF